MNSGRKNRIAKSAHALLSENGFAKKPGFRIESLVEKLNVRIERTSLGNDLSGAAIVNDGMRVILVNKDHPPSRQRFTIAHELGHLVIHESLSLSVTPNSTCNTYYRLTSESVPDGRDFREVEANYFAACLLMSEEDVVREINSSFSGGSVNEDGITTLAKKFGVSEMAMAIRLSALGYT